MNIVFEYFPELNNDQRSKILQLKDIYNFWNSRINVISRKDFQNFYVHHVLHSLAITKYFQFADNSQILDVGTGGGFPGIPLAIAFPTCQFHLVDSIGKKIKVVEDVSQQINLTNVQASHTRVENLSKKYDFVVSRAVTRLPKILNWTRKLISSDQRNEKKNGLLYLKGGDFEDELLEIKHKHYVYALSDVIDIPFFDTKKLVHVEIQ